MDYKIEFPVYESTIFPKFTEEHQKLDEFLTELITAGVPLRNVNRIVESKDFFGAYDTSKIKMPGSDLNKGLLSTRQNEDTYVFRSGSFRYLGRRFNLLFGAGILELDRANENFNFTFSYETTDSIEKEILKRLKLKTVNHGVNRTRYGIKVYNSDVEKIRGAFKEIKLIDKKLKLKPEISRHIDDLVR